MGILRSQADEIPSTPSVDDSASISAQPPVENGVYMTEMSFDSIDENPKPREEDYDTYDSYSDALKRWKKQRRKGGKTTKRGLANTKGDFMDAFLKEIDPDGKGDVSHGSWLGKKFGSVFRFFRDLASSSKTYDFGDMTIEYVPSSKSGAMFRVVICSALCLAAISTFNSYSSISSCLSDDTSDYPFYQIDNPVSDGFADSLCSEAELLFAFRNSDYDVSHPIPTIKKQLEDIKSRYMRLYNVIESSCAFTFDEFVHIMTASTIRNLDPSSSVYEVQYKGYTESLISCIKNHLFGRPTYELVQGLSNHVVMDRSTWLSGILSSDVQIPRCMYFNSTGFPIEDLEIPLPDVRVDDVLGSTTVVEYYSKWILINQWISMISMVLSITMSCMPSTYYVSSKVILPKVRLIVALMFVLFPLLSLITLATLSGKSFSNIGISNFIRYLLSSKQGSICEVWASEELSEDISGCLYSCNLNFAKCSFNSVGTTSLDCLQTLACPGYCRIKLIEDSFPTETDDVTSYSMLIKSSGNPVILVSAILLCAMIGAVKPPLQISKVVPKRFKVSSFMENSWALYVPSLVCMGLSMLYWSFLSIFYFDAAPAIFGTIIAVSSLLMSICFWVQMKTLNVALARNMESAKSSSLSREKRAAEILA